MKRSVVVERRDELGLYRREVTHEPSGSLRISGHDLGSGVSQVFGAGLDEYEFERCLTPAAVRELCAAIDIDPDGALLDALIERFGDDHNFSTTLESLIEEHGITSEFWSRIGD